MVDVAKERLDLTRRTLHVNLLDLFPRMDRRILRDRLIGLRQEDPHRTIYAVARELWNEDGGYGWILDTFGFYDEANPRFIGHCHQITPALGLVLNVLGFTRVSYLECYRIEDHFPESGRVVMVQPDQEPDAAARNEFCAIGRIPYCCLEVIVGEQPYYVSGKHVKPNGIVTEALLAPGCYREPVGPFRHQSDSSRSGTYLATVTPKANPDEVDFSDYVVWRKQGSRDTQPELFATYLRMQIQWPS